jgi:hypothetical protein
MDQVYILLPPLPIFNRLSFSGCKLHQPDKHISCCCDIRYCKHHMERWSRNCIHTSGVWPKRACITVGHAVSQQLCSTKSGRPMPATITGLLK